jgi:epsilon-lactone hydrolase
VITFGQATKKQYPDGTVAADGLNLNLPDVKLTGLVVTSSGASMTERAGQDPISTPAMLAQFASGYLAGADPKTPLASPLFASLAGLPPLLIQVGTADLLLSDSERLAAAAAEAGADVTLQIGEGLPHVYQLLLGTPEAAEATEQIGKFLRAQVREPDSP